MIKIKLKLPFSNYLDHLVVDNWIYIADREDASGAEVINSINVLVAQEMGLA